MSVTLASDEDTDLVTLILAIGFVTAVWWSAIKVWRGELNAAWARSWREDGPTWAWGWWHGNRRQYRSLSGSGYAGMVAAPAFIVMTGGDQLRIALGESRDWWLYWLLASVGFALFMGAFAFALVYLLFGVPDRLRPPCQRGWEVIEGVPRLVRPEAFREHPKYRPP
jgi:hypothetical protein